MIDHEMYGKMLGAKTLGRARKMQSDWIESATWDGDIQSQVAYFYDYYHDLQCNEKFKLYDLHPEDDVNKTPILIKFIRHAGQTYNKDPVTYWLQFQPGQEHIPDYYDFVLGKKYGAIWPVGLYVDIMAEDGKYNKWLVVNTANYWQNQFPTWELLKCDFVAQWIYRGQKYECPCVLQSQNSYNGVYCCVLQKCRNENRAISVKVFLRDNTEIKNYCNAQRLK